jgi:hypothetical protein
MSCQGLGRLVGAALSTGVSHCGCAAWPDVRSVKDWHGPAEPRLYSARCARGGWARRTIEGAEHWREQP